MNRFQNNSFVQLGLLLTAFAFGTLISMSIPTPSQLAAYKAAEASQPAADPASFDQAAILESFDQANEIIGVDVDPRRLQYVSQIG